MEALHLSREPGKEKNCTLPKSLSFRGRYRDKYTHSQQPSAIRSILTWLLWRDTVFSFNAQELFTHWWSAVCRRRRFVCILPLNVIVQLLRNNLGQGWRT